MADEPKITLSEPPWEPVNVEVVPDGPSWPPHDVPIHLDGPPWEPVDVKIHPDPPPWLAFDVPIHLDAAPWEPRDVPIGPDAPPSEPFDVPTTQDSPPWAPTDVQTTSDGPAWTPIDVAIVPDGPAWAPIDVQVTPDGPPWSPVAPNVVPDEPSVLSMGLQVRDHRIPPPYQPEDHVTTGELADRLRKYDRNLSNFLDDVGEYVPFVSAAGKGAFDPLILADWLRNYKDAVGLNGMAKFIAEQAALYAMNPVVARFFDPSYFAKLAVPGLTGMFNTHIDTLDTIFDVVKAQDDRLMNIVRDKVSYDDFLANTYDPSIRSTDQQDFTVDQIVDARTSVPPKLPEYFKEEGGIGRFDATKYFEDDRRNNGGQNVRGTVKTRLAAGLGENVGGSKLAKSAATNGIIRIPVPGDGVPKQGGAVSYDGVVLSDTTVPNVDDDDVRLPLCFTDLRKDPASDSYRHVFFQPMNLVLNQSFSPNYNDTQAFGRVDQMVGYVGTTRTWTVSFEVHAFAPEDLMAMYHKMTWLTSLVYPTYGADALMRSGPVCRMRIGDVAATSQGGLPGVIRNLSFDFAECLWELQRNMKVPRSFGVQIDYTVLHDGPVGLLNGMFGVLKLPSGPSTNLAGASAPNQESTDPASSDSVTIATGRWARFGEPTRKG